MTAPLPTPGEVEEMRDRHVPYEPFGPEDTTQFCRAKGCGNLWPCDAARLLALVGNLHEEVFDHWCTPGCDDGCDIAKTRRLTTDTIVTERWKPPTWEELANVRASLDRIRRAATGEAT